jgi:hypothetical protein
MFLEMVAAELTRAEAKHGGMSSHHEAYAVILEEVDEYWDQVKLQSDKRSNEAMLMELVQIAAMCAKAAKHLLGVAPSLGSVPDAKLVAAAPDLLAVLVDLINATSRFTSLEEERNRMPGIIEAASAAVAKARGKSEAKV